MGRVFDKPDRARCPSALAAPDSAFVWRREPNSYVFAQPLITPEQRAAASVASIMRSLATTVHFQFAAGQSEQGIALSELRGRLGGRSSRLPILDAEGWPKYMIHQSRIDEHVIGGGKLEDSLAAFIAAAKKKGLEFGPNKGFVVVAENTTLAEAKRTMEQAPPCQDIFVTKGGTAQEPMVGWISNVRMAKFLEA